MWSRLDDLAPGSRFAAATLAVMVAVGLGLFIEHYLGAWPWATLYLAVALGALVGGQAPGLFATMIGTGIIGVHWTTRWGAAAATTPEVTVNVTVFVITGVLMSLLGGTLRVARRRAHTLEARLHLMADNAPVLVWLARPDQSAAWFNRGWLEFRGRSMNQERGTGWTAGIHPQDTAPCRAAYDEAFRERKPFEVEYRLRRHDGEYRWIVDRGVPIVDHTGDFAGFIGSCIDIHGRRQAEQEREQLLVSERAARAEVERANQAKEDFLNLVSHELRAPLNAIVGWTFLLREQLGNDPDSRKAITIIERNARTQARIVDDLLDMSRLMTGRMRLDRNTIDLRDVVQSAFEAVESSAHARNLTVERTVPESPVMIVGDSRRLSQSVINLLSNAIKFTGSGGQISIRLRAAAGQAAVAVEDTGQGIAADFLPFVFDRFRQADGSRTRRHGGLGIGLALVKGIVHQHGGTVTAESAGVDRGATFEILLPLATTAHDASGRGAPAPAPSSRELEHLRIMVVDDDADTCELLRRVLEDYGADVHTATSVQDALARWTSEQPDVLVSDISMPEQDGYALVREVRRKPIEEGGAVPAIAVTAFGRPEDRRAALGAGFQAHLRKPVEPFDLVTAIASLHAASPRPSH
jgi:PAS domain S-box-containing protein